MAGAAFSPVGERFLSAQEQQARKGLPPLKITKVRTIQTRPNAGWSIVKIETSEPGLYGIGSASDMFRPGTIPPAVEVLATGLVGRDPDEIEDIWQASYMSSLWRNNATMNAALSGVDMALWDIKGKRANMPVYELLGGRSRVAVPVYEHAREEKTFEGVEEAVRRAMEGGFTHIRVQLGGYGGGGFIDPGKGERPTGGPQGRVFDEELYIETIPKLFEYLRNKIGFGPKLLHDAQEHFTPLKAIQLAKLLEPSRLFFLEDVLNLEQLSWYRMLRQNTTTPQAAHEKLTSPSEYMPLISEHLVDFIRFRVSKVGGITPARKIAAMAELYGVRTAFQEGADNDPVNFTAALHIDRSIVNFGIQEENHFSEAEREIFSGTPIVQRGYVYSNEKPGLGIDINETLAAKLLQMTPSRPANYRYVQPDRKIDGTFVRP
ncbi:MAG TPA: enolase C-terminal domain-like protein [Bryobacteraceae bacterium]|jgi:mannonate dehydratase|nr:enolase C-terminal domain-like protein [Bryobacteraceae bacterium]